MKNIFATIAVLSVVLVATGLVHVRVRIKTTDKEFVYTN